MYAMAYPNCRAYDPAFAYEVGVIVRDGIRRMYGAEPEDCFYYLTLYNENYVQPPMPEGVEDGIVRGMYRYRAGRRRPHASRADPRERSDGAAGARGAADARRAPRRRGRRVERAGLEAAARRRDRLSSAGTACTRTTPPRTPYVTEQLGDADGPIVAVTDWVKAVPDSIARFVPEPYVVLGTDGYGFSDMRTALRRHFEVDAAHVAVAVLDGLAQTGDVKAEAVADAIAPLRDRPRRDQPPERLTRSTRSAPASVVEVVVGVPVFFLVVELVVEVVVDVVVALARSTSARVPEPSRNRPSSKPCLSSRASRNRRARPFLGTSSPAWES